MPMVASIQFFLYMATTATIRVMLLERMLEKVPEMVDCTPAMSLVILVMISPWLFVVKNFWDILCR